MKNTEQIISKLVSETAVSGYEWELGMASAIQEIVGVSGERVGNNLVYTLPGKNNQLFISAHMDEVGWIVTKSTQEYCRILPVGDIPIENLVGRRLMFNSNGETRYSKLVQPVRSYQQLKVYGLNNLPIGSIGTFEKKYTKKKDVLYSPSLDNKTGCTALLLLYNKLNKQQLPISVTLCFSSKEEVGVNGVMTAVRKYNPDLCIDVDSAYAKSNNESFPEHWCVPEIGKGPAFQLLGDEFVISDRYRKIVEQIATEQAIPFQYEIPDAQSGATNSKALQNNGYETIQVNIPVSNQHSSESAASFADIEQTAELLFQFVMKSTPSLI